MTYALSEGRYRNVDPRQLVKFMRIPGFQQSLSAESSRGITRRILTAKWSPQERIVYDAVSEGYTSLDSLPVATGLTGGQIRGALAKLTEKGYIKAFGVGTVEGKELPL